ncbi:MAG: M23 family metallopeptidase [Deltaproteobacteria bacterium]
MAKKSKNMDSGRLSFIVIPSTTARPIRGDIPRRLVTGAGIAIGVIIIAFLTLTYLFSTNLAAVHNIKAIKAESQRKELEVQDVRSQLETIEKKQESIIDKQEQVKKMMGIKKEPTVTRPSSQGGKGGVDIPLSPGEDSDMLRQTQAMINSLDRQEKELDDLLAQVTRDSYYFRCIPNLWPTAGELSSEYGFRDSPVRRGHKESFHNGLDIANYSGTPVYASGDGRVAFANWKSGYGRMVIIQHGHGFTTEYGHLSAFLVKQGETVKKGEQIARMGSTGASTGPHLHFIIMKNGSPVDPLIYLP